MDEAIRELSDSTRRLRESVDSLFSDSYPRNHSASTININAGGIGVWIATTCCIAMLCVSIMGSIWISREFTAKQIADTAQEQKIAELGNYLQAIYAQAPQLQPPKKEKEDVDHRYYPAR